MRGFGGTAPFIRNLSSRWMSVLNFTLWRFKVMATSLQYPLTWSWTFRRIENFVAFEGYSSWFSLPTELSWLAALSVAHTTQ
jgi:hypothetical protein